MKNLRQISLDWNVFYMYRKFPLSTYYSERDIDVQQIKVENTFFVFSASSHVFPFIYFYNINVNVYRS